MSKAVLDAEAILKHATPRTHHKGQEVQPFGHLVQGLGFGANDLAGVGEPVGILPEFAWIVKVQGHNRILAWLIGRDLLTKPTWEYTRSADKCNRSAPVRLYPETSAENRRQVSRVSRAGEMGKESVRKEGERREMRDKR